MAEAVIVSTARSPIGRASKGSLTQLRPDDLAATIAALPAGRTEARRVVADAQKSAQIEATTQIGPIPGVRQRIVLGWDVDGIDDRHHLAFGCNARHA